ncbi:MAG TPA: hypothetical protein VEY07_08195 [Thermoplasmata archaeon]|nr:hypothetical protein [Thermoplasmata archaeon]
MSEGLGGGIGAGTDLRRWTSLLGVLAGGLSVLLPYFDGLTAALGALLIVSLLAAARPRRLRSILQSSPALLAAIALAAGWGFFLLAPSLVSSVRGLALGLGGVPAGLGVGLPWRSRPGDP